MPQIREYVAGESVITPLPPGGATQISFNQTLGLGAVAEATDRLSGTFSRLAVVQEQERLRVKSRADQLWAGERGEILRRNWSTWLSQPEQVADPTVSSRFLSKAKEDVDAELQQAPSPEAADTLKLHIDGSVTSAYGESLTLGRRAGLARAVESLELRAQSTTSLLRAGSSHDDFFAASASLHQDIDASVGSISTEAAKRLHESVALDHIYAAIDEDPALARALIDQSQHIDERQRHLLRKTLDAAMESTTHEQKYRFGVARENARALWESGKNFEPIPEEQYVATYGADLGKVRKEEDDAHLRIWNRTFKEYNDIRGKTPQTQMGRLEHLSNALGGAEDALVLKYLTEKVSQNQRLLAADSVAWLADNNDEIQRITQKIQSVSEAERGPLLRERTIALLKYQGPPPIGAPPQEADKYLALPEQLRSVLSVGEAEQYAAMFNSGAPSEMKQQLAQLAARFPDEQHQIIALNDMVRLPKGERGVKQELQLAIQNRDAWWLDQYLAAISQSKELAALSDVERTRLEATLTSNGTWQAFQRSIIGDNFQRADEVLGFKNGIIAMTRALMRSGKSEKAAVTAATNMLINESLGFTTVNDRSLIVPRQRSLSDRSPRTDEEIQDIGRRLGVALSFIDPAKIDSTPLNLPKELSTIDRIQRVRDQVVTSGFFQPMPDGQGATLYFEDELGGLVQARDRKGRAFIIKYDELPGFSQTTYAPTVAPSGPSMSLTPRQIPMTPGGVDDLIEKTGSDLLGTTQYRTHWPMQPSWIRNE
jgi:hypothetical protein